MEIFSQLGACYCKIEAGDVIEKVPVELGDGILYPGEFIKKLGEKKRSNFEMKEGFYLRYIGKIEKYILFDINHYQSNDNIYYAFAYVDNETLFVKSSLRSGYDIRIKHLEKLTEIKNYNQVSKQLSLF